MSKKLSFKTFLISQVLILFVGLLFLGGIYYLVNFQSFSNGENKVTALGKLGPITKEPNTLSLDITSPDDNVLVFQHEVEITGKTSPDSQILVSNDSEDRVTASNVDGSFSVDFSLDPGVNELKIIVFDKNGDSREVERMVYYSKEKI